MGDTDFDPNNFSFELCFITFAMISGTLFTTANGVRTEHYSFEYTGPPLYTLARAFARRLYVINHPS